MGKKKNSVRRKGGVKTKNKKDQKKLSSDMIGGFLIALGLIVIVFLTFSNIGIVAEVSKSVLKGIFGNVAFVFALVLMWTGGSMIVSEKKVNAIAKIESGVLLMVLLSVFLASFFNTNFEIKYNIIKYLVNSYNNGVSGVNPYGLVGIGISSVLVKFAGVIATRIITSFVLIITLLVTFDISFKQLFSALADVIKFIVEKIGNIFSVLFREEENDITNIRPPRKRVNKELITEPIVEEKKLSKRQQKLLDKQKLKSLEIDVDMAEENNVYTDEILNDENDQLEFDFSKLDAPKSKLENKQEVESKQKRDEYFKLQKEKKEDKSVKEVMMVEHTEHIEEDNYEFPPLSMLNEPVKGKNLDKREVNSTAMKLQKTLLSFGVDAKVVNVTRGPTVTRYELSPSTGVKVSKIVNLADDIALNLAAKSIRIEAPIPGRAAVGIEVPNLTPESVAIREVIESDNFQNHKSKLAFALGKDAAGEMIVADIAKMPHVLIAGATGAGKSVCINSLIVSLLYHSKPSEVKMILIDPKMVELSGYNGIPHLLIPVVTDPKKAAGALNWAVQEMVNRYKLFAEKGVKDIKSYNNAMDRENGAKLPQIVVIVDELADLMMVAPNDVEDAICRLAQMARAAGMHLVIATQRPSVDVITGIIKANIPSRIACTVSSQVDSRTILDMAGAEKLLGKGDMLYYPVGETKPLRVQGNFISEEEIEEIVEYIKSNTVINEYSDEIMATIENTKVKIKGEKSKPDNEPEETSDEDELLNKAIDIVVDLGQASASMLQRKLKIGFSRAGRIIDQMEERGIISESEGSKARKVLISKSEWQEIKLGGTLASDEKSDYVSDLENSEETKSNNAE